MTYIPYIILCLQDIYLPSSCSRKNLGHFIQLYETQQGNIIKTEEIRIRTENEARSEVLEK